MKKRKKQHSDSPLHRNHNHKKHTTNKKIHSHSPRSTPHSTRSQESGAKSSFEGIISVSGKGTGYLRIGAGKDDVEVSFENLNTALNGDIVKAEIAKKKGAPASGKVVDIIRRAKVGFSGTLNQDGNVYYLNASDSKMYMNIAIPKTELAGAKVGQKIFVTITKWDDPKTAPIGKVERVLGQPLENNAEMEGIALERGFDESFPSDVEREAKALEAGAAADFAAEIPNRRDFRGTTTFTIDPEDAKDFDDAISLRTLENGNFEIGIHIADVSHFVRKGTALDTEGYRRGTSVYLVDRTIPMLPEVLSNDLCSLKPNVDRLTMSAVFTMNKKGEVLDQWFGRTVIHSDKRFSYEEAQKVLDTKNGPFYDELLTLNTIAKELLKQRFAEGAMSLDQEEVKFILDDAGKPVRVYKKVRGDTNKLIEELMLLANKKVAESITEGKGKGKDDRIFVYRIHGDPNKEKMADLAHMLKTMNYKVTLKDGVIPRNELNAILESLDGKDEKGTIQTAVIRSMAKAIYSTGNIGHYGLAFEHYTHFTSPIRRYPDVTVHRLMMEYLEGKHIGKERWHEFEQICQHSSEREKYAAEAERASIKYKQAEYMESRVGETFDGVITGVSEWGIFVEEKETKCEGLVRVRDLADDFYNLDEKNMVLIGRKYKKRYRIGDHVKIKVRAADRDKKMIDYVLISENGTNKS